MFSHRGCWLFPPSLSFTQTWFSRTTPPSIPPIPRPRSPSSFPPLSVFCLFSNKSCSPGGGGLKTRVYSSVSAEWASTRYGHQFPVMVTRSQKALGSRAVLLHRGFRIDRNAPVEKPILKIYMGETQRRSRQQKELCRKGTRFPRDTPMIQGYIYIYYFK